ncbi:MAG: FHA domain-containing protein [Okeania sp. SIO3I5]|uniref:FHA domain-containing protein n=1 Tax=Okeania sp. SIO3I5 TaxID=2607805 RepID=UPI0013B95EFA|nr:FHA domain-containing protein [Okeania sp. SIO3I5]NEQ40024.1 FHA domain-containing protein [Okeania sp. SIO3I5]
MINLALLHPTQLVPVQHWSLRAKSLIRIGRASDNDVIIYNAIVSHYHAEIWENTSGWIIINFGANGTYVNGKPIIQVSLTNEMIIRLGSSGPKIKIWTQELASEFAGKKDELSKKEIFLKNKSYPQNSFVNEEITQIDFD